jgi:hypothetical protein
VLLWVAGVAAIVLLIACANVANLMFARCPPASRDRRATRLGVSRQRLVAQFIVEGRCSPHSAALPDWWRAVGGVPCSGSSSFK